MPIKRCLGTGEYGLGSGPRPFFYLILGVPLNLFLTTCLAYGLSRKDYPGRKLIRGLILFTMLFGGGIIPLYLVMKSLNLTNTIWAVILAYGVNTFNAILMSNFFSSLPESLLDSAKLDGAGDWKMIQRIIMPLQSRFLQQYLCFI